MRSKRNVQIEKAKRLHLRESLLKFRKMDKNEIMIVQFDVDKVYPELLQNFVDIWQKNGFNNFIICPTDVNVYNYDDAIKILKASLINLEKLK